MPVLPSIYDYLVPRLFPKLELGARPLEGDEPEQVLKAANLSGLPQVLYAGDKGLGLIAVQGSKNVPNPGAPIAKEVLEYLQREHAYGNKVTGKALELHFRGIGYGWELDVLRLVLAVLLRAGSIEVTHQGRRFRNHQDPQCRAPFTNTVAFRAASFAPRETIDLKTLTTAVEHLEELTGEEVDVEEGAIAGAFKKVADEELKALLPVEATARAHELPVLGVLTDYRETLDGVLDAPSDDCVRILSGEGKTLREKRERFRRIREALSAEGLATVKEGRRALAQVWPALGSRPERETLKAAAEDLEARLKAHDFDEHLGEIHEAAGRIRSAYADAYRQAHKVRHDAFATAADRIKGLPAFAGLGKDTADRVLKPLLDRACEEEAQLEGEGLYCSRCQAALGQMEADGTALPELERIVRQQVLDLTAPPEEKEKRTERVRLAEFFPEPITTREKLESCLKRLKEHLEKLLEEGARIVLE